MRMRFLLLGTVAASLALNACQSRSAEFTVQDEATIRTMFDSRVADIRAGNWVKWSNQHVEGVVVQPPNSPTVKGRAALLAWGQGFPPIDSLALSDIQIWGDGNLAYATSAYALKLKDLQADVGKELLIFRRSPGGQWQVVAFSLSSDLPRLAASPANPPSE
jgi:ketosteroid isomerase-like protein